MFGGVGIFRGGVDEGRLGEGGKGGEGRRVAEESYGMGEEGTGNGGPDCGEKGFVENECLRRIASCGVVDLIESIQSPP